LFAGQTANDSPSRSSNISKGSLGLRCDGDAPRSVHPLPASDPGLRPGSDQSPGGYREIRGACRDEPAGDSAEPSEVSRKLPQIAGDKSGGQLTGRQPVPSIAALRSMRRSAPEDA